MSKFMVNTLVMLLFVLLFSLAASAQATRTWVSGVGDDVNPCSRTAPCKTFAGAISKTATGGEINILDPGGYGTLTITKSITVNAEGSFGSALNSGGINGIVINAVSEPTAKVKLRGLYINGAGTTLGLNGIRILAAGSVTIENTVIHNQSNIGIDINPSTPVIVSISNVHVYNTLIGVSVKASSAANTPNVSIDNSRFVDSLIGVLGSDNSRITCTQCIAANNDYFGYQAQTVTNGTVAEINLESSVASGHKLQSFSSGVASGGGGAGTSRIRMSNVSLFNNQIGFSVFAGGFINSFGNNKIDGNTSANVGSLTPVAQQ